MAGFTSIGRLKSGYWCPVSKKVSSRYLGSADKVDGWDARFRADDAAYRVCMEEEERQRREKGETNAERTAREARQQQFDQVQFLEQTEGSANNTEPTDPTPSSEI